jgi:hypothetical protein
MVTLAGGFINKSLLINHKIRLSIWTFGLNTWTPSNLPSTRHGTSPPLEAAEDKSLGITHPRLSFVRGNGCRAFLVVSVLGLHPACLMSPILHPLCYYSPPQPLGSA